MERRRGKGRERTREKAVCSPFPRYTTLPTTDLPRPCTNSEDFPLNALPLPLPPFPYFTFSSDYTTGQQTPEENGERIRRTRNFSPSPHYPRSREETELEGFKNFSIGQTDAPSTVYQFRKEKNEKRKNKSLPLGSALRRSFPSPLPVVGPG